MRVWITDKPIKPAVPVSDQRKTALKAKTLAVAQRALESPEPTPVLDPPPAPSAAGTGIEKSCVDCQSRYVAVKPWQKRCLPCHVKYKFGAGKQLAELRAENARLRAENAELRAELQRYYDKEAAFHEARFRARCAATIGEAHP
jgi:hypothetical protein